MNADNPTEMQRIQLAILRKEVSKSARSDKGKWLENLVEETKKANERGDSRAIFQLVKTIGGQNRPGSNSLLGTDPDIWIKHFQTLLGEAKEPKIMAIPELQNKRAWRICEEWLENEDIKCPPWNVNISPPSLEEVEKALKMAKKRKAVANIIPTELFQNSATAMRILTFVIARIWDGEDIPEDWLRANLVLLYKGKGTRADPNNFRGISLLSAAEKILGIIILSRIDNHLTERIMLAQAGFRKGLSCRNAIFFLLRRLEDSFSHKEPLVLSFVDFCKAFDSLNWENMWKILEFQGIPKSIVKIIRRMYTGSSISVRLSQEGLSAEAFPQLVGIRQGCSLSPAMFVLTLDFAMRAFEKALAEMGIQSKNCWLGYADDIVLQTSSVESAEIMIHELQSACSFLGLHINASKTEVMGIGVTRAEILESDASKERIIVKWINKSYEGWLIDWSGRKQFLSEAQEKNISLLAFLPQEPTHLLIYDDGEFTPVLLKKGGWVMDSDGDNHRAIRLGSKELLKSNEGFRCDTCNSLFGSKRGLQIHLQRKFCRIRANMSIREQSTLRITRQNSEKRSGRTILPVEVLNVSTITGQLLPSVAKFKYLGTMVSNQNDMTQEVVRRIGLASSTFATLGRVWDSKMLSTKLKVKLYSSLVGSILLYNCETWSLKKQDISTINGFHFRCLRRITSQRLDDGSYRVSREKVFADSETVPIATMLRSRRLRWIGHLLRGKQDDPAAKCLQELVGGSGKWWGLAAADLRSIDLDISAASRVAIDRHLWRRMTWERTVPPD